MNGSRARRDDWPRLLLVLLVLWPLVLLFFLPGAHGAAPVLLWIVGIAAALAGWILLGRARQPQPAAHESAIDPAEPPPQAVAEAMHVEEAVELGAGARAYKGRLNAPADVAFNRVSERLGPDYVPLLQGNQQHSTLFVLPANLEQAALERKSRPVVNWVLFLLTVLTTTYAGAAHQGINLLAEPARFAAGLPYSLALLAILGCHELGHYFAARRHGMNVTPPYFIPVPFALGTFGAFIQMRTPPRNRRTLFDVAVAGPLAGLVVAIPALHFGLQGSEILSAGSPRAEASGALTGASVLLTAIAHAALDMPQGQNVVLSLNPVAFGGWLGLMVTALNLLPIGQLDGGHIARAMLGTRIGAVVSMLSMLALFLLAVFVWPGLLMWAVIVFFLTGRPTPPLNDITRITPLRTALGIFAFLLLLAIVTPAQFPSGGLRCPYL